MLLPASRTKSPSLGLAFSACRTDSAGRWLVRGAALLAGQLGGVVALGVVQACFYIIVGTIAGVRLASGIGGVAVLLVFAAMISLAFGSLGAWVALRTGSTETVQSLFPVFFVFLFISSATKRALFPTFCESASIARMANGTVTNVVGCPFGNALSAIGI